MRYYHISEQYFMHFVNVHKTDILAEMSFLNFLNANFAITYSL